MEYYCFLKTMFELLLDYLQIRFGNLDTCGQDVLDTDNDIRPVGICGNLAFNAGEIALDNTHPVAYNKGAIVEADTVGIQVHHEHEIGHLFVRNHKHGTGEEVFHIEKTHAIDIGKVAGRLLGGADKDQIADDRDFTALAAVLQLRNHTTGGKVIIDIQMLLRLQPGKGFAYGKLLLVTSAGSKPIFLCFRHLKVI